MRKAIITLLTILIFQFTQAQESDYINSINQWHKARIEDLKQPDGWLNLEGLFWLHKGINTFGKAKGSDCHYLNEEFPDLLGNFIYEGDSVIWTNAKVQSIFINKKKTNPEQSYKIFDLNQRASVMDWSHFSWVVIKREDKVGIRFRNFNAKTLLSFKGIERFPINKEWHIKGKLVLSTQDFLMITNVLGQTAATKNAGRFEFEKNGQSYSLDVIDEGGKNLFIVFADQTSGVSTYGAGRFIELPKPDAAGNTEIDFNNAYNPPCAFTAFATCPLPPKQNRLALNIEAGEKNYGHH
jgi:uncharacterized protein (DUF1684 family)